VRGSSTRLREPNKLRAPETPPGLTEQQARTRCCTGVNKASASLLGVLVDWFGFILPILGTIIPNLGTAAKGIRREKGDFPVLGENRDYSRREHEFFFSSQYIPEVNLEAEYSVGKEINLVPVAGAFPELADATTAELVLTLRPNSHLRNDNTYIFSRLKESHPGANARVWDCPVLEAGL